MSLLLAGVLSARGDTNLLLLVLTSILGAYLGALVLDALGAMLGLERSITLLAELDR